jgi:exodeoxyribonuclease V alpha subunit
MLPLFGQNNPLPQEAILVFQAELLDVVWLDRLLQAIPENGRIILVGDPDALPPLGPGAPFKHLWDRNDLPKIDCRGFGSVQSSLARFRAQICDGMLGEISDDIALSVSHQTMAAKDLRAAVVELAATTLPRVLQLDPVIDVQVVCPVATATGADGRPLNILSSLNSAIGDALRTAHPDGGRFCPGDKVVLMRDITLPNLPSGSIGVVVEARGASVTCRFGTTNVTVDATDETISHGWVHTAYRLNGQHYPLVVAIIAPGQEPSVNRELLYTCAAMATEKLVFLSCAPLREEYASTKHPRVASGLSESLTPEIAG